MSDNDDFTVELESNPDDTLTVRLDGDLDMANAEWVDDTLGAAGAHHRRISVQLDQVSFIDSTGIGVLESLETRGRELGIAVSFDKPSDAVRRTLDAAGLRELID
ncbi:MAG: STAS domain-containing protein [Ilumatobacteraceae bacterium]